MKYCSRRTTTNSKTTNPALSRIFDQLLRLPMKKTHNNKVLSKQIRLVIIGQKLILIRIKIKELVVGSGE